MTLETIWCCPRTISTKPRRQGLRHLVGPQLDVFYSHLTTEELQIEL